MSSPAFFDIIYAAGTGHTDFRVRSPVLGLIRRVYLRLAGLFAGIGGLELGFASEEDHCELLCEIDNVAATVLKARFPEAKVVDDVRDLTELPKGIDTVTAGFPCQDLSQAGRTNGINGEKSGIVAELFRLLRQERIECVVIENVPFMLQLDKGAAMEYLVHKLEELGYEWAYRVVDSRAFGVPQRRQRVFLVGSRAVHPAKLLFGEDKGTPEEKSCTGVGCGFYWTEGTRGLGWAVDSIPTLKGGSGLGIPSPPAIWLPDGRIVTPDIRDAERLQGFPADWTSPAERTDRKSFRWRLVGNAVTVPAAKWVAQSLLAEPGTIPENVVEMEVATRWPAAAFGLGGKKFQVNVSKWPLREPRPGIAAFLRYEPKLLSAKATSGFMRRLFQSKLRYPIEFAEALRAHHRKMAGKEFDLPIPEHIRLREIGGIEVLSK